MHKSLLVVAALTITGVANAQSTTYKADPTHTYVYFEVKHLNTSTLRARFDRPEGNVTLDHTARTGTADITVETASISSGYPAFDGHLKGKDFFNVDASPTIRFIGGKFLFDAEKLSAVAGNLTLLGKTQPVTLRTVNFNCYEHPSHKRETCGGDFEATIARSQ